MILLKLEKKIPEELKIGLLSPIQKPNKSRGPCKKLRPIILLSILRKILTLFDMSKAFDTVNRHKLFEILEEIMTPYELHIMSILTNLPKIKVKINQTTSTEFITQVSWDHARRLPKCNPLHLYLSESLKY